MKVRSAIFERDGSKAPGPDGYSIGFFQHNLEVLKGDLMKAFEEFHRSGIINSATNETYRCFIPKTLISCRIGNFKPIILVTSLYKIIAKVLSVRLKSVLSDTILVEQGAFIVGR